MRPQERRFMGRGNAPNGYGWMLVCAHCGAPSKMLKGKHSNLPPNVIIKKLSRAGWMVGDNAERDVCPECVRKSVKSHIPKAAKALKDLMAPMVKVDESRSVHFSELTAAAKNLDAQEARQLIQQLRGCIPPPQRRPPKSEIGRAHV